MKLMITGGAGFIGSALIRHIIKSTEHSVINVDSLTYSGNLANLDEVTNSPRYQMERVDVCDRISLNKVFANHLPDAVMHLAAESHVDRAIDRPSAFIQTNILGTYTLLETATAYWHELDWRARNSFRFLHVSTDEVYGTLGERGNFTEESPYDPSSPYSASKAAADHLARAWCRTYGLPVIITNSSNNYGPYQFPEKLVPLIITRAISGSKLPVYGDGNNVRDWLYVEDHVRALLSVLEAGQVSQTYNIGGSNERKNIEMVRSICELLDELIPGSPYAPHQQLITFVSDRPGHDRRYAVDATKIRLELGWQPTVTLTTGLRRTVQWYLENPSWIKLVTSKQHKCERLGLGPRGY